MKRTAYCKINLTLEILGTDRPDGFHDLKTIMHKIPLGDVIELEAKKGKGTIDFYCDSNVCDKEDNLAYKAAKMYFEKYKENTGKSLDVTMKLFKVAPTGAGLGGGSADAAVVLDMLAETAGCVSESETLDMAKALGSDVPFCLGRYMSAYCTGRGEICENIDTLPRNTHIVLAKPLEGINTKGIYGEYEKEHGNDYSKSKSDDMIKALANGTLCDIGENLVNDFEEVCIKRLFAIQEIKEALIKNGAVCSQMSGSGSCVFGLFDDIQKAKSCGDALKKDGLEEVFVFSADDFEKMYKGE